MLTLKYIYILQSVFVDIRKISFETKECISEFNESDKSPMRFKELNIYVLINVLKFDTYLCFLIKISMSRIEIKLLINTPYWPSAVSAGRINTGE